MTQTKARLLALLNTRNLIPPQIFALSFFFMFSSCASLKIDENAHFWEQPTTVGKASNSTPPVKPQPFNRPTAAKSYSTSSSQVNAKSPTKLRPHANEKVASLPPAPFYTASSPQPVPFKKLEAQPPVAPKPKTAQRLYPPLPISDNPEGIPETLFDDLDADSLRESISRQLEVMETMDPSKPTRVGDIEVTQGRLINTLIEFERLMDEDLPAEEFTKKLKEQFYIMRVGLEKTRNEPTVLFTGYYTPVIPASRRWSKEYSYPLYRKPQAQQTMEASYQPASNSKRDYGFHMVASSRKIDLTREAIDGHAVLADKNLEVAWLKDEMERYFLHIQGSGFLRFEDDELEAVQYMGSNDMPYHSVGKMLIQKGIITTGQGSMQGIKKYFRDHPEDIQKYLYKNKRYIFFNINGNGPRGSGGAELLPGRAIATDKRLYPAGGLVFLSARKPILNAKNEITEWEPFTRFVLDQDTGSAIKGRGRADLYFGVGDKAGAKAGRFMKRGKMFYLLVK